MSEPRPCRHRLVEIKFLDHCVNQGADIRPIECAVVGTIVGQCRNAWYVASWLAEGEVDANMESFSILKKVVKSITPLSRGGRNGRKVPKNKKAR